VAAGFHYSIALDPSSLATTYAAAGTASSATFPFNDAGTFTVYGRVIAADGGSTDYQTAVTVTDVPPTAVLSNDGPIGAGSTATASFSSVNDVSPADVAAGFRYSFALDPSALATSYAAAGNSSSGSFSFSVAGTHVIYGRVLAVDNGASSYQTTVTVASAAPTGVLSNNGPIQAGSAATVSFSNVTDVSGADIAAGFHYSFALDPSALAGTYAAAGTLSSKDFVFSDAGTFVVYGRVLAKDEGATTYQTAVTVTSKSPVLPPPVVPLGTSSSQTKKGSITGITLNLSGAVSAASAQNPANYHLYSSTTKGAKGKPGKTKVQSFGLQSATYNPQANSITLTPKSKVAASKSYLLDVTGLVDSVGRSVSLHFQIAKGGRVSAMAVHGRRAVIQRATDHVLEQIDIRGILGSRRARF
jgi:hypothetical protein